MAKPWQVKEAAIEPRAGYVEPVEVDGSDGEHERTRSGPGFTPAGEGRPQGRSVDDSPIDYRVKAIEDTYGIRDNEELYAPPPPVVPANPSAPALPEEFEAVWQRRALERQAAAQKPSAVINTEAFLRPEKGVVHELVGTKAELPYRINRKDQVIEQLEEQIRLRQDALKREEVQRDAIQKAAFREQELRVIRVPGQLVFLSVVDGNTRVIANRAEAIAIFEQLLS